jgi:flagellar biosynthesis protein FlhB
MAEKEDKTEPGTQKKRDEARTNGQIVRSRDLVSLAVMSGILFTLYFTGRAFMENMSRMMGDMLSLRYGRDLSRVLNVAATETFWMLAPLFIIAALAAILASVVQGGVVFKPLTPSFEKLNPLKGLQKLFSLEGLMETAKSFLKLTVGVLVFYIVINQVMSYLPPLAAMDVKDVLPVAMDIIVRAVLYGLGFFAVIAAIDYLNQWWQFERSLKMSKEEIREESKESEGDPLLKARIRSLQREAARRRMMHEVPKATVVITNPTHLAVALKYEKGGLAAPRVIAKGAGVIASNIRDIARRHGIPLVEDKPLARALYKLELDSAIPQELYKAVAKILAYIYKLRGVA